MTTTNYAPYPNFQIGDLVCHHHWGRGVVTTVEPGERILRNAVVGVRFLSGVTKRILPRYSPLELVFRPTPQRRAVPQASIQTGTEPMATSTHSDSRSILSWGADRPRLTDSRLREFPSWLAVVEHLSATRHFTLMKFTTGWKAVFGTPLLDMDPTHDYGYVWALRTGRTAEGACRDLLVREGIVTPFDSVGDGSEQAY